LFLTYNHSVKAKGKGDLTFYSLFLSAIKACKAKRVIKGHLGPLRFLHYFLVIKPKQCAKNFKGLRGERRKKEHGKWGRSVD